MPTPDQIIYERKLADFSYTEGPLSPATIERLRSEIRLAYAGAHNRRYPQINSEDGGRIEAAALAVKTRSLYERLREFEKRGEDEGANNLGVAVARSPDAIMLEVRQLRIKVGEMRLPVEAADFFYGSINMCARKQLIQTGLTQEKAGWLVNPSRPGPAGTLLGEPYNV